jgi:hypothetical protein
MVAIINNQLSCASTVPPKIALTLLIGRVWDIADFQTIFSRLTTRGIATIQE